MFRPLSLLVAPTLFFLPVLTACDSDPILAAEYALCRFTANGEALDDTAVVRGKILIVYKSSNFEKEKYGDCELDGYGEKGYKVSPSYFPEEMYAKSPEEIDTLILIENKKGKFLKSAIVRHSLSRNSETDVYRGITEISMIDYKTSTVIRKSAKENADMPDEVPNHRLKLIRSPGRQFFEYVIEPSVEDLRSQLKEFSREVKTSQ